MRNAVQLALVLALVFVLAACAGDPQESKQVGNFQVQKLFTDDDGCTVKRFNDGNYRTVYYASCKDATDTSAQWSESCGKNCTRQVEVSTGYTEQQ